MYIIYIIAACLITLGDSNYYPHIFNNFYLNCEYYNPKFPDNYKRFQVINKQWKITFDHEDYSTVFVSPCQKFKSKEICDNKAVVCLKTPTGVIINYGEYFIYKLIDNRPVLVSSGGDRCIQNLKEDYSTIIEFSGDQDVPSYKLNGCKLKIKLPEPNSKPFCKILISGNIIDLTSLQKLNSVNIQSNNKGFELSFCKKSEKCDNDAFICETGETNSKTALANVASQNINYNVNENRLILKGQFGTNKKQRVFAEIHIKCNWKAKQITNAKALSNSGTRKHYFEVESSLACIKLPLNCLITENPFVYNLTSLSKNEGWIVQNVSGIMRINVCGNLNSSNGNNVCKEQSSQVCLENDENYINLGTTPTNFAISDNGIVKGSFVDGSICSTNQERLYSTEIEFKCHSTEEGPFLVDTTDCVYKLEWKTPAACPIYLSTGTDCTLEKNRITGILNLKDIHTKLDRVYPLSDTSYLRYNLCGPLNKTCNNDSNVSVCLIENGKEFALGFKSTTLSHNGLLLQMNLEGDSCNDKRSSVVKVNFICNCSSNKEEVVVTKIIENCIYEMNITTSLACVEPKKINCTINNYDLSPLMKENDNYVIVDKRTNVKYVLNVCRSLTNTLCVQNSGACLINPQEPLFNERFKSLGLVNEHSVPSIENNTNNIIVRYTGAYCEGLGRMETQIRFVCSETEELPYLLKNDSCSYEFLWKTSHACLKSTEVEQVHEENIKSITRRNQIEKHETIIPNTDNLKENISIPNMENLKPIKTEIKIKQLPNSTPDLNSNDSNQSTIHKNNITATTTPTVTTELILKKYNCIISNNETAITINSNIINAVNISSNNDNYTIAIDRPSFTCNGLICHNNRAIISTDVCPVVQVNYSMSAVKLLYKNSDYKEDWRNIEVWLKCNTTSENAHIDTEFKFTLVFIYPTNSICSLLQKQTSNSGIVIGITTGLLVSFLSIVSVILFKKYRNKYQQIDQTSSTANLNVVLCDMKLD